MRNIFFSVCFFFTFSVSGQTLNLDKLEHFVENVESGEYREKLSSSGFELIENSKEGSNGVYEKWVREDNAVYVTIQHNDTFKFTKLLVASAELSSKPTIRNLLDEVSRNYSKKTINDQFYYLSEENPELTIHIIELTKDDTTVEGVMFFRKY